MSEIDLIVSIALGVFAGNVATRIFVHVSKMRTLRNWLYAKTGVRIFMVK